CQQESNWSLTF
nr:immunoglobulin light chain junction region [Macaca mulatta]MOV75347.1 immunoglobulin light chain junction region [Macaca mulatta]MOV79346.1 immunoglobulin light chain junction region [Macaca mulatta]